MHKGRIDKYGRKYIDRYEYPGYLTALNLALNKKNMTPKRLARQMLTDFLDNMLRISYEPDDGPLTDEQYSAIREITGNSVADAEFDQKLF